MTDQESRLYQPLSVAKKYAIIEAMRLRHRGGVANALNIKSHFS